MFTNLGGAFARDKPDVVHGLVELPLDDLSVAPVFVYVLYLKECGTHRGAYDHVRLAALDDFAGL